MHFEYSIQDVFCCRSVTFLLVFLFVIVPDNGCSNCRYPEVDILPMSKDRGFFPCFKEIVLHRSRWLTQSYCSFTVDDAPPTRNCLNRCGQHGQPHLFDIDSCVRIPVQHGVATLAGPAALLERETRIDSPAHMAGFSGRRPPVDFYNG